MAEGVEQAVEAIRAGRTVLLPTDGVYGLCASAYRSAAARRLYALKGRPTSQPVALLASSLDMLFECVPELRGRSGVIARTLLPGPYTLILPNPAGRYGWLSGDRADVIGVRVALLPLAAQRVLDAVGAVCATSANLPGGPDPSILEQVPAEIRAGCDAAIDAGALPGTSSTVIDFSGLEPVVVRGGAGDPDEAIALVEDALGVLRRA